MKKYLKVVISSRGEMDCNIVFSSVDLLEKKVEGIRNMYEEEDCLEEIDEFVSLDISEDGKCMSLGVSGEESEIYIREDEERYIKLLELWNDNLDSEEFRDLVYEIEIEIYE